MSTSQEEIKEIRAAWAHLANKALEQAGYQDRIDHRSYVDQGKDLQPTIHEGSKVTQLRRQGIETEISRFNDEIKHQNEKRLSPGLQPREQALEQGLNRVEDRFEQWKKDQEAKKLAQEKQLKLQQEQDKQTRLWAIAEGYYKISATDVTERHGEILEAHEHVLDRIQRLERILKDSPRNPFSQNIEG